MGRWVVALAVMTVAFGTWAIYQAVTADAGTEPPSGVVDLIDEWYRSLDRLDGSVVDLYQSDGYHLYGTDRFALEDIPGHLQAPGWEHEWITEPLLIVDEGDGRYVVTRGMRNTIGGRDFASALTFTIVEAADGELEIAYSEWTKVER